MNEFRSKKVWHNGKFVKWESATVHGMSHALHYGTAWFEGIRCYRTVRGAQVFRLAEHVQRLFASCRIYRTEIPFSPAEIQNAVLETIRVNELEECYVRPLVCRGYGPLGVNPLHAPVETFIFVGLLGPYLGQEAKQVGVDVCVTSWARPTPNTLPSLAKAAGNYTNAALIKMEAVERGFVEGIALDTHGFVSEGTTENIFLIWRGKLFTPPASSAVLPGITRSSIIRLARDRGYEVVEQMIPREMLYIADEIFLVGTAVEVIPVRSVDRTPVGRGTRGPITARLQEDFFTYVEGNVEDRYRWLSPVFQKERATQA